MIREFEFINSFSDSIKLARFIMKPQEANMSDGMKQEPIVRLTEYATRPCYFGAAGVS
jgi:hypothetical protein